ncbi:MAG: hypothetical protein KAR40_14330 [Candidatus Sabulitectum sp.]|nr:hypothetical protein [Candidatus Sabulitectum sp.]
MFFTVDFEDAGRLALWSIATINEVAAMWGLSYSGVMYQIDAGKIIAEQSLDGRWLLWLPSVVVSLGTPPHPGKRTRALSCAGVAGKKAYDFLG